MRAPILGTVAVLLVAGCLGAAPGTVVDEAPADPLPGDLRISPTGVDAMEVDVASDPTDPSHLVAASNLRGQGHSGFGVYVSPDGGRTWSMDHFDPEDAARLTDHPAGFSGLSDPVVAFDGGETVYLSGLAYIPTSTVFLARSDDGGRTWSDAYLVDESDPATEFNDKEWFAVGPDGTLVVAWQKEPVIDSLRAVEYETGLDVDVGNVVVSRSDDGGQTWSDPVEVDRGMHNNGTQVVFAPDGTAHAIWVNYEANTIDHVRSEDLGRTWSDPRPIASVRVVPPFEDYDRMHTLPGLAAGPDGTLVATWHDARDDGADVRAVASADDGASWGDVVTVAGDGLQLYPWVDVGPDGRVHVSYHSSGPDDAFAYVVRSADGVHANGTLAFGEEVQASDGTYEVFGHNGALGDYTAVEANRLGVLAAWSDPRGDNPGVHAARIGP